MTSQTATTGSGEIVYGSAEWHTEEARKAQQRVEAATGRGDVARMTRWSAEWGRHTALAAAAAKDGIHRHRKR
jgi:hypothetical protein